MIILIYGKSDSGKSTLAKKITNELKLKPIQQILPRNFNLEGWRPEKGAWCNDRTWKGE